MQKRALTPQDMVLARQTRTVALVMGATVVLWFGAQLVGGGLGLDPRYVFLFDFAAIAAFVWVLVNVWQIWRKQSAGGK